jgi:hypothetical protein
MTLPLDKTIRDLVGTIVVVQMLTTSYGYPRDGVTLDEAWTRLRANINHMRNKLGDVRTDQILEMAAQAYEHYKAGYLKSPSEKPKPQEPGSEDIKLGTRLMQDIEWVVRGREPFAYPKELYRWPLIPGSRPAGDPDLEKEFREET